MPLRLLFGRSWTLFERKWEECFFFERKWEDSEEKETKKILSVAFESNPRPRKTRGNTFFMTTTTTLLLGNRTQNCTLDNCITLI